MAEIARFPLEAGGTVYVEVEPGGLERIARGGHRIVEDVQMSFDRALSQVRDAAGAALGQFQEMAQRPDEVEIKFGVTLDAEVGAVLARTGITGHLEITVRWSSHPTKNPDS